MATDETILLEALFHHVVLPPKLPPSFDGDNFSLGRSLGKRLQSALGMFRGIGDEKVWQTLEASLQATVNLHEGPLYQDDLLRALKNTQGSDVAAWLGIHIEPQNAALIVHVDHITGGIVFEEFETAAPVSDVLKAEHALTWDFPDRAIAVLPGDFSNASFLENLTLFLEEASSKSFDRFAARASKGGQSIVETRDCPSSTLISEILMSLLEGMGHPVYPRRLRKRVRDDIVLDQSEIPWRRSPYWLVLRVTLGRILSTLLEDAHEAVGRVYYKFILCTVVANLLRDCVGNLQPEMTLMLQAKLCRRLAKLESEQKAASGRLREVYDDFFTASSGYLGAIVANARARVASSWEEYKRGVVRRIPALPFRASERDLVLALPNSRPFLLHLLSRKTKSARCRVTVDLSSLNEGTVSQVNQLADKYSALVDYGEGLADDTTLFSSSYSERLCEILAISIQHFIETVGDAYVDNSLLMSRYLLRLFELWMRMDMEATAVCPLLLEFHPVFVPSSLDVLCLQTRHEMERLGQLQQYLESRIRPLGPDHDTIFSDPSKPNSFPPRYVCSTQSGEGLAVLGERIDAVSQRSRSDKQSELARLTRQYDELTQAMQGLTCTCTRLPDGNKDVRGCTKCWKKRCRKRLRITAHEDLLPSLTKGPQKAQRATILLQLRMPSYLSAYRSAVWKLHMLGTQVPRASHGTPQLLFKDLSLLQEFASTQGGITLASRKKSFRQTHYGKMRLPKQPSDVVFPFGAEFTYYDSSSCLWADQLPKVPWFEHLLGSWLPKGIPDPYASVEHFSPNDAYHPSSYEIMANEFSCPPELSVHEFSALQRAVSGRARRWLVLLVELGTTNFNFSSQATMKLFDRLALQAGPAVRECGVLREAHSLFDDEAFCARLYELLRGRLDALTSSWREAGTLLVSIRSITCEWIVHLRNQIRSTSEGEVASKAATFTFWAALINRRTFWAYKDAAYAFTDQDVQSFFRASIALQENLLANLDQLDPILRHLLIEDLSNSYIMRHLIRQWFSKHYRLLEWSINETWADSGASAMRSYSPWTMLSGQQAWWITAEIARTKWTCPQVVHYHLLQGHLLVDGKPLGRLPLQMRQDPAVQQLFGGQHLLTRPSSLLEYQLASEVERHHVHFGFRDGRIVIQAIYRESLLEYVPRAIFKGSAGCDLPTDLIDGCVHWLNLYTGQLEMRRKPWIWRTRISNWILDVRSRVAMRNRNNDPRHGKPKLGTKLVEPKSVIGQQITSIFRHFEDADKLTIYQPVGVGSLSVEMKRLEIRFSVNRRGLLECLQLASEIDPQQDAGTFYGLSSQIVLRNVVNPERRTVLVPIGEIYWKRRTMHVEVRVVNQGVYASFAIDKVLGRLDCPPEPLLLYLKAALHALTSFPLPDALTLRTGTEEARHCLLAARSQPWSPLKGFPQQMLSVLKSLSPKRWYYPPGIELYQKVEWDDNLTMWIQHEQFALLVDSILLQSQQLEGFSDSTNADLNIDLGVNAPHLLYRRGRIRRQLYERVSCPLDIKALASCSTTFLYDPSKNIKAEGSCRVYQTIRTLRAEANSTPKLNTLSSLLERWADIGGFKDTLLAMDIETLLSVGISRSWGSLVQVCRRDGLSQSYKAHFLLALLAFDTDIDLKVVQWLVALYKENELRDVQVPEHSYFSNFCLLEKPMLNSMGSMILAKQPLYDDFCRGRKNRVRNRMEVTALEYEKQQMEEATRVAARIRETWPHPPRSADEFKRSIEDLAPNYIDIDKAWKALEPELYRLLNNLDLSVYLNQLEKTASRLYQQQSSEQKNKANTIWVLKPGRLANPPLIQSQRVYRTPSLEDLMVLKHDIGSSSVVEAYPIRDKNSHEAVIDRGTWQDSEVSRAQSTVPSNLSELDQIIKKLSVSSETTLRKQYSKDLQISLMALIQNRNTSSSKPKQTMCAANIRNESSLARQELREWEDTIRDSLSAQVTGFVWLSEGGLWPCLSRVSLLEQLRDTNSTKLGPETKAGLVHYGILITRLQQLLRIHDATLYRDGRRLCENQGIQAHSNWRPLDHPEWLLLEIDNNLLIRPSQIDVAKAIISPASNSNSVLQMNMGQGMSLVVLPPSCNVIMLTNQPPRAGKTSCIMPMAVAVLADGTSLCRLVVPSALLLQTAQVIQSRIGGLLGRIVRHVPFSRRSPMRLHVLNLFQTIHKDMRDSGGVMLCLPEHIMSFKLSGLQQLVDGELKRAKRMVDIQRWLERWCRDILDESDFTLSAKTQLIYPSGIPTTVDGHPQRWLVVEELLSLIEGHIDYLGSRFSGGIEILRRHRGYPIIHILRAEVEDCLTSLLVADVCRGRLPQLQFKSVLDVDAQRVVSLIVSGMDVDLLTWQRAAESLVDDVLGMKSLYLLRGLISQRLLLTCLQKRWNVQYGLHPQRAPVAVPFEAKGVPSPTAEYGHPDTTLILTCLAFYQSGLAKPQVVQCLQHVFRSDDPPMQYERLTHGCNLPAHLGHWNFLTLDDEAQTEDLWTYLRFDTSVVNYFLNNFVFPIHAKQFAVKLQASGWDIPLLSSDAPCSRNLTTGFSGTNDNKRMLPQTIRQDDLPSLVQTNAEVLSYLLEPRNQRCYQAVDSNGRHLTESGLLELLRRESIQILIDVGAHILEMENHHLAATWLDIYPDAQGAVYFDADSRIMVRARFQRAPVPLLASPFADNLDQCVVYIDQAHTRGTDLKLPIYARGAVTLGLGQTKDQTVQAAMRLRQLGSTQSMAFIVPPEVYRNILDLRSSSGQTNSPVKSSDVVYWLLEQSCKANEKMMSLHTSQGFDFCHRTNALWKYSNFFNNPADRLQLLNAIQQREDRTLEQLYGPRELMPTTEAIAKLDFECLKAFATRLCEQKLDLSGDHSSAFEELELEREVEFEFEQLREKQNPVEYTAVTFPGLDPAITRFVNTGHLQDGDSFIQAFDFLGRTRIGRKFGVQKTSSRLFVSKQFTRSMASNRPEKELEAVRPIEWILWSAETATALIVIPEEAELLLTTLRNKRNTSVLLLTYAAPVTKSMWRFNMLDYFTIPTRDTKPTFPPWLPVEIGVLAGRLYFDYSEYAYLTSWLGISQDELPEDVPDAASQETVPLARGLFVDQPLKFLLEWLTYRRQTQDIMHTLMGYVCQRKKLDTRHSFFTSATVSHDVGEAHLHTKGGTMAVVTKLDTEVSDDDSDWEEAEDELMLPDREQMKEELDVDV
ncbi:hypothetical protein F66182_4222 [Fusarium sp. NRRL 66182]|nr:hypothetical protein F66182_4222 [Fusarium sp. NRRL 66182]